MQLLKVDKNIDEYYKYYANEDNSKVIVINNILGLIVNDKEIKDGVYREIR